MSKTEVESMNLANKDRESYIEVFLPESLVKLVLKIAKNFKLSCFDEFSILDTLQFACHKNFEHNFESKKDMTFFIMSVIRITEKFNKASLKVGIPQLGSSENLVQKEFKFFKSMDFHVCAPRAVETLHEMIESHLSEFLRKDFIFDFSVDILRIVYAERSKIYDV